MKNGLSIALVAGIVLIANVLSQQLFFRLDLTQGGQYTLSRATRNILRDLDDPVLVKAYFSKDLPAHIAKTRKDFQEMLIEYANLSRGYVDFEFVNPNEDQTIEQEALQLGIAPVMINVREKDQMTQQKAFLGAVIKLGDQQEVLPFVQPGGAMEYALTTSIKKLAVLDKPSVGMLQGHGEPGMQELSQVYQSLSILYQVEPIDLTTTAAIEPRFRAVALVNPRDSFSDFELDKLDAFLANGGRLLVAFDRVEGDLNTAMGSGLNMGLADWLARKGIIVEESFVIDMLCGQVSVQQRAGFLTFSNQISFPYLPLVQSFPEHPITEGLNQVILQFASPIRYVGDTTLRFTPLITSSDKSGTARVPVYFDIQREWSQVDFPQRHLVMGAIVEGRFSTGPAEGKLVVFSDGNFAVSGQRGQNPDNVSLLVNSIDWLSDDTGLVQLRTKGVATRPIKDVEDTTRSLIKYLNFLLPILLILLYGFIRSQRSKQVRLQRMQERWV